MPNSFLLSEYQIKRVILWTEAVYPTMSDNVVANRRSARPGSPMPFGMGLFVVGVKRSLSIVTASGRITPTHPYENIRSYSSRCAPKREPPTTSSVPPAGGKDPRTPQISRVGGYGCQPIPQVRCFCPPIRREIHSALRPQTPPPCCARSPAPTGGGLPVVELPRCEPKSSGGPLGRWLYNLREVAGIPGWKWLCNLQEVVTWSGISRTSGFPTVGTIHSVGAHQDWRNAMSPGAPAPTFLLLCYTTCPIFWPNIVVIFVFFC